MSPLYRCMSDAQLGAHAAHVGQLLRECHEVHGGERDKRVLQAPHDSRHVPLRRRGMSRYFAPAPNLAAGAGAKHLQITSWSLRRSLLLSLLPSLPHSEPLTLPLLPPSLPWCPPLSGFVYDFHLIFFEYARKKRAKYKTISPHHSLEGTRHYRDWGETRPQVKRK